MLDYILTPNELNAWAEFYTIEPFLVDRVETQLSFISSQIYNIFAKTPKRADEFRVSANVKVDKKAEFEMRLKDVFKL